MQLLIYVVIALAIVGLLLWALGQVPMDATIAKVIRVVIIVAVFLWLIYLLAGLASSLPPWPPPPLHR